MYSQGLLLCIAALTALQCHSKQLKTSVILDHSDPSVYDDIVLSPEQEQEMKERGFYTARKWPKVNGVVTVPYYYDTAFFPQGDPFRVQFRAAAEIYRSQTCIDWVETVKSDSRHKVRIFKGNGCFSSVGMTSGPEQDISLPDKCQTIGTVIHEMGHAMGLFHTQSRPDRDNYVRIWLQNVERGKENNFDKSTGDLFGIPYDYKSMMQYGGEYFSINGSYTMTTIDPFAMFAIGSRVDNFRYSDSAFLNIGYECISDYKNRCGDRNCLNNGFVGKDCKCRCPENTAGERCDRVTGPFFSDRPTCGGDVTKPGVIVPNGYPHASTREKCIFAIKAPDCKLPTITFTEAKFYWNDCPSNKIALEVSPVSYGYMWCDHRNVPLHKTIVSETQRANIFYHTGAEGFSNLGFKAVVDFINDPKCGPGQTPPTTKPTPPVGPVNPSSPCSIIDTGTYSFEFFTKDFPASVKSGTSCVLNKKPPSRHDLILSKIEIDFQGSPNDEIEFEDPLLSIALQKGQKTHYLIWPLTIKFNARSGSGRGFKITSDRATGLPRHCNGETIVIGIGETKRMSNPLSGLQDRYLRCAFSVLAPEGKKVSVKALRMNLYGYEQLRVSTRPEIFDEITSQPTTSRSNELIVYYIGVYPYGQWELQMEVI